VALGPLSLQVLRVTGIMGPPKDPAFALPLLTALGDNTGVSPLLVDGRW
jgi:hypothetical protein